MDPQLCPKSVTFAMNIPKTKPSGFSLARTSAASSAVSATRLRWKRRCSRRWGLELAAASFWHLRASALVCLSRGFFWTNPLGRSARGQEGGVLKDLVGVSKDSPPHPSLLHLHALEPLSEKTPSLSFFALLFLSFFLFLPSFLPSSACDPPGRKSAPRGTCYRSFSLCASLPLLICFVGLFRIGFGACLGRFGLLGRCRRRRVEGVEGLASTARRDADQQQQRSNSIAAHCHAHCVAGPTGASIGL